MISINTKANKNRVQYTWKGKLASFRGNNLFLEYDINVSKTPTHLFNFIFGVLMQDPIVYTGGIVKLSELTANELLNLEKILQRNYDSRGCAGRKRGYKVKDPPIIETLKIVDKSEFDGNNTVICANGFGKDGINVALLAKELGYTPRCFTLKNQYKRGLWNERWNTARKFYNKSNIEYNLVNTNFFGNRTAQVGFYPYVVGIPLAKYYGSNVILDGIQIHNNKTSILDGSFYCPGETIFTFNNVASTVGIRLSSPLRPISNFGSQKLLAERYKEFLPLQRSCMHGSPWCGKCSKCNRKALYLQTLGINPETIKLSKYSLRKLRLKEYMQIGCSVRQVLAKSKGEPYKNWIEGANVYIFPLIWEGRSLRKILSEHFPLYRADPGDDGEGYTLNPSKWREWLGPC